MTQILGHLLMGLGAVALFSTVGQAADVEMQSGDVRVGIVCGSQGKGIALAIENDPVGFSPRQIKVKLKPDATGFLLGAQGLLVRVIDGKDVAAIDKSGIAAQPDRSRYFFAAGNFAAYPALQTILALGMPSDAWLDAELIADEEGLMGQFVGEGQAAIVGFISGARGLNQLNCRVAGSIRRTQTGEVRVVPTISLTSTNDTITIPVDQVASSATYLPR